MDAGVGIRQPVEISVSQVIESTWFFQTPDLSSIFVEFLCLFFLVFKISLVNKYQMMVSIIKLLIANAFSSCY